MSDVYGELEREVERDYEVKWREHYSGVAWPGTRRLGAPRPRGPVAAAIVLHEIGHLSLKRTRPRCLEEYEAWCFALATMRERGIPVTRKVLDRRDRSLRYAVRKARRRGLRQVPSALRRWA